MTVATTTRRVSYVASGTVGPFAVPFGFFEIGVYLNGTVVSPTLYSISQTSAGNTGSVTFASAVTGTVTIVGETSRTQGIDFISVDAVEPDTAERGLDRLTMIAQEIELALSRAIRASVTADAVPEIDLSGDAERPLVTDGSGGLKPLSASAGYLRLNSSGTVSAVEVLGAGTSAVYRTSPDTSVSDTKVSDLTIISGSTNSSGGVDQTYVDAADAALDARLDALEASTPGLDTEDYHGSVHSDQTETTNLDLAVANGWWPDVVYPSIHTPTPNTNDTDDRWSMDVVNHGDEQELTQVLWPDADALDNGGSLQLRGRRANNTWTRWYSLLRQGDPASMPSDLVGEATIRANADAAIVARLVALEGGGGSGSSTTALQTALDDEIAARTQADYAITDAVTAWLNDEYDERTAADALLMPKAGGTFTGAITLAADPVSALQPATKQYADALAVGLSPKPATRVKTTTNINLAGGAPSSVDGVALAVGNRVLVGSQTATGQNGIYRVVTLGTGANGAWSRVPDGDTLAELDGAYAVVLEGSIGAGTSWVASINNTSGVLGTEAVTWTQFSTPLSFSFSREAVA